jgi:hypothetical protein
MGQRILTTDADDYPLMDVRLIALDTDAQGEAAAAPGADEPVAGD